MWKSMVVKVSAGLALLLATSACGDDDDGGGGGGGGSSGSVLSCDTPAKSACFEVAVPPGSGQQAAADQCTAGGGIVGTGCPTASVIGECKGTIHYFYYTGYSGLDQAEQVCTGLGGTWSTP